MNDATQEYDAEDPRITAYVFDELSDVERQSFESALSQSPELRKLVEQTRSTIATVQAELQRNVNAGADQLCLSSRQRDQVNRAIENKPATSVVNRKQNSADNTIKQPNWRRLAIFSTVAAAAVLTVWLGPVIHRSRQAARVAEGNYKPDFTEVGSLTSHASSSQAPEPQPPFLQYERVSDESEREIEITAGGGAGATASSEPAPIVYPDANEWKELSSRRGKYKDEEVGAVVVDNSASTPEFVISGEADQKFDVQLMVTPRIIIDEEQGELLPADEGREAGQGGDKYDLIVENDFLRVSEAPLSTFSIDVDTASYSKVRMYLMEAGQLPRPDAVRIEELINYFPYDYAGPDGDDPFAARQAVTECPWNPKHRLVRVAIKGKEIAQEKRPASNLVFLLDVSGSMDQANKLPLLKRGMKLLVDQLGENDRVAIVVYAGAAGLVLDSTTGDQKQTILSSLDRLSAGGSTNGGQGIQLAYQTALDNFIPGGTNRVVLCTDGDFNVGTTGTDQLVRMVEEQAKANIFISVLGFGMGNHNDSMLEQISNKGNGNYAFVDTDNEAKKVLVEQLSATLITIAKDVKIQVEFNPTKVAAYRLIGYENRVMAAQDFNDDTKDAGEIGAGHNVTALYEIIPAGESIEDVGSVDGLRYQRPTERTPAAGSDELLTLKLRYKQPEGETSKLLEFPLKDAEARFAKADKDFQFAAAVASFGMLLRQSEHKGNATYASVLEIAESAAQHDPGGYRAEFLEIVRKAKSLAGG